jgi:hypothetical protein
VGTSNSTTVLVAAIVSSGWQLRFMEIVIPNFKIRIEMPEVKTCQNEDSLSFDDHIDLPKFFGVLNLEWLLMLST